MLKVERRSVEGYKGMEVPFQFIKTKDTSKSLAILLPGAGYTTSSPLFHYSTEIFLNRSVDVLEVNYLYKDSAYDNFSTEELSIAIKQDVKTVFDQELPNSSYKNFYIIGKSLGTIAISSELKRPAFKDAKAIWLTPLLQRDDVFGAMIDSPHKGLCFIGDADRCYVENRFAQLKANANLTLRLFPGVDHSMDSKDGALDSIDILKRVITEIQAF